MKTALLIIWYLLLASGFSYCTYVAFEKSLWSTNAAKPWAKRGLLFLLVIILSICAVSYFR